jgi:uridine kinase
LFGGFDWVRLEGVLRGARAGRAFDYEVNDFEGRPASRVEEELPSVVIVEGIRLLRPELAGFFDLTVWIDCQIEVAAARGVERDRLAGADAAHVALWGEEWVPKDRRYFEEFRPDRSASLLFS